MPNDFPVLKGPYLLASALTLFYVVPLVPLQNHNFSQFSISLHNLQASFFKASIEII
jgi:hypothetical protein